jgi:hypothetical protein
MSGAGEEVSEVVSAVLSLIIPGVGHIAINGQTQRGAIWLVAWLGINILFFVLAIITLGIGFLLFLFVPLINVGSAVDAYLQAQKINSGEIVV